MSLADIYCTGTVYIKNRSAFTDYGAPSFGTATLVRARVEPAKRLLLSSAGQEVQARWLVIVPSGTTVSDGAMVSVDGGTTYADAVEVRRPRNMHGQTLHIEIYL